MQYYLDNPGELYKLIKICNKLENITEKEDLKSYLKEFNKKLKIFKKLVEVEIDE